jgi:hypothetical protein
MEDLKRDVARLDVEAVETKRRLERLEDSDRRHEEDVRTIMATQEGTKAYVTQILNEITGLKTQLFTALSTSQSGSQAERKGWQELFKDVLKMTLGAIVAYLFTRGA